MKTLPRLAGVAGALLAAAALPARAPAFDPSGEVVFIARGAMSNGVSFDAEHLVGATANLSRRDGGGWTGDLAGQNVDLEVSDRKVAGSNVDLHLDVSGDKTTVRGLYFGSRISIEVGPKTIGGRVGACSIDLARKGPGLFSGDVGCVARGMTMAQTAKATLRLAGEAAATRPPMPQFALALIAVLPG